MTIRATKSTSEYLSEKNENTNPKKDIRIPMLTEALFTTAKIWKQPGCPSTDNSFYSAIQKMESSTSSLEEWRNRTGCIQRIRCYQPIKGPISMYLYTYRYVFTIYIWLVLKASYCEINSFWKKEKEWNLAISRQQQELSRKHWVW